MRQRGGVISEAIYYNVICTLSAIICMSSASEHLRSRCCYIKYCYGIRANIGQRNLEDLTGNELLMTCQLTVQGKIRVSLKTNRPLEDLDLAL